MYTCNRLPRRLAAFLAAALTASALLAPASISSNVGPASPERAAQPGSDRQPDPATGGSAVPTDPGAVDDAPPPTSPEEPPAQGDTAPALEPPVNEQDSHPEAPDGVDPPSDPVDPSSPGAGHPDGEASRPVDAPAKPEPPAGLPPGPVRPLLSLKALAQASPQAPGPAQVETVPEPVEPPPAEVEAEQSPPPVEEREEPEGQLLPMSDLGPRPQPPDQSVSIPRGSLRPTAALGAQEPEPSGLRLPATGYEAMAAGVLGAALALLGTVLWRLSRTPVPVRAR